ncbi:MAG: hypothetical protein DWQ02_27840 [Bacteroidetes bacterium]|nr:MAG: hypothetical protein DWQ02_27840 [Bacteroidota bacterium]
MVTGIEVTPALPAAKKFFTACLNLSVEQSNNHYCLSLIMLSRINRIGKIQTLINRNLQFQ